MLKNLPLNDRNETLVGAFTDHLRSLGYSSGTLSALPSGVRELLWRLEGQGIHEVEAIESEHLEAHYAYLRRRPNLREAGALSPSTVCGYVFALRLFFAYLERLELIADNPMSTLQIERRAGVPRPVLSRGEVEQLYRGCRTPQERALLGLFYGCGLRRIEAVRLNRRDVDFRGGYLYVRAGKGGKRRVIPLSERTAQDIKAYLHEQRPQQVGRRTRGEHTHAFMLSRLGTRVSGGVYWKRFKALVERVDQERSRAGEAPLPTGVSLHHLRHSIATHLLENGMPLERVRDFLGHACLETTQIYTRVNEKQLQPWT